MLYELPYQLLGDDRFTTSSVSKYSGMGFTGFYGVKRTSFRIEVIGGHPFSEKYIVRLHFAPTLVLRYFPHEHVGAYTYSKWYTP